MSRAKEPINPFYVVLVVAGIIFSITACAYAVMTFRTLRGSDASEPASGLMQFIEQYGGTLLAGELFILSIATVAAIALDGFRKRREDRPSANRES
jgi:hypothetical protein